MKFHQKKLSVLVAAPVALAIAFVGAPASHADSCDNGLSVGLGGKGICVGPKDNGNTAPGTPPPAQSQPTVAPTQAAPSPTVPDPIMTPGPVQTVTVEVPVPVIVTPAAPTVEPTTKPTVSNESAKPAPATAAAPVPSPSPSVEQLSLQGTADQFRNSIFDFAPWMFFTGLIGLIAMLIVAKKKRLFPFEEPQARAVYAPVSATKEAGTS